ncbi:unnamed protein product [Mycena citricolor]|uniref:F-box domain-containing protein n=1 Tax=Mycena citricolor TaxID=2018698 RepID=A0AAD2JW32_9AGAR|nr:unnamed protein product [Mycena citricolor]
MASLPAELLSEVFLASIPLLDNDEGDRAQFPWTLTHVCRHWRRSAISFPQLWSSLDLELTSSNEEREGNATLSMVEAYLERSREHPLVFRVVYDNSTRIMGNLFLETLSKHMRRWRMVRLDGLNMQAVEYLSQGAPSDYTCLREVVFTNNAFPFTLSIDAPMFEPLPWAQLTRFHDDCGWPSDNARLWEILGLLTNVVDLHVAFCELPAFEAPIILEHVELATFAVHTFADRELCLEQILECFQLPRLKGLSLHTLGRAGETVLYPVPEFVQGIQLRVLRLCGAVNLSNDMFMSVLKALPSLVDFSMDWITLQPGDVFAALKPVGGEKDALLPALKALRVADLSIFNLADLLPVLWDLLSVRFSRGGLQLFEMHLDSVRGNDPVIPDTLEKFGETTRYKVCVKRTDRFFWTYGMSKEFV